MNTLATLSKRTKHYWLTGTAYVGAIVDPLNPDNQRYDMLVGPGRILAITHTKFNSVARIAFTNREVDVRIDRTKTSIL